MALVSMIKPSARAHDHRRDDARKVRKSRDDLC